MLLIIFAFWWDIFPYHQLDKCLSGKNPFFLALPSPKLVNFFFLNHAKV